MARILPRFTPSLRPMKIATKVILDIASLEVIVWDGFEYEGSVAACKKGRDEMASLTSELQGLSTQLTGNGQQAYDTTQGLLKQDIGSSAPGSLTPAAQQQLAADNDNITRTYNGMKQTAMSTMGQRGLGSAPSGFAQTTQNSINQGQANASTGAYRNAVEDTQKERNFATSEEGTLSGQQTSAGLNAAGGALTGAMDQNKMGSTAGDILGGIAEAAPIAAAPFTGGASLGAGGLFGKLGGPKIAPSSVGAYGGAS